MTTRWIEGDAKDELGNRFLTKAALKRAVAEDPTKVRLYSVEMFTTIHPTPVSDVDSSDAWTICGPNPYTTRKWYATIRQNAKGKVTVS